jgi:hypothetical protein
MSYGFVNRVCLVNGFSFVSSKFDVESHGGKTYKKLDGPGEVANVEDIIGTNS